MCGKDELTGRSFEHRRNRDSASGLESDFCGDIAAYTVMSNHIHLVIRLNKLAADQWYSLEVIERWHRLFSGTGLSKLALRGEALSVFEQTILDLMVATWRKRLCDLSWFTKCFRHFALRAAGRVLR